MAYTKRRTYRKKRSTATIRFRGRMPRRRSAYGRFGRIPRPEMKHVVDIYRGQLLPDIPQVWLLPPLAIPQGHGEGQRVGNRIASKFLNTKVCLFNKDYNMQQGAGIASQTSACIRYVLWKSKDPNGVIPPVWADPLTLTSFINTKRVYVLRHGYIGFHLGQSKVKSINVKCNNRRMNFIDDADQDVNTTERYYITIFSSDTVDFEYQSKFYYTDN